jgi:hypothetical protein
MSGGKKNEKDAHTQLLVPMKKTITPTNLYAEMLFVCVCLTLPTEEGCFIYL